MPTQNGKSQSFKNFDLTINGFRFDAYDTAGCACAWQGDFNTVTVGADGIAVIVEGGAIYAIVTPSLMSASDAHAYCSAWILARDARSLTFTDRSSGTTFTSPRAKLRQFPDMTFSGEAGVYPWDIHCPALTGAIVGLLD